MNTQKQYSKEEKAAYFKDLREKWARTAALSKTDAMQAAYYEAQKVTSNGLSIRGFTFVAMQMKAQGLDGLPYVDAKTFKGWQEAGFKVKKGEKSTLQGITWLRIGGEQFEDGTEGEGGFLMPKQYALFHRLQVEAYNGERVERKVSDSMRIYPKGSRAGRAELRGIQRREGEAQVRKDLGVSPVIEVRNMAGKVVDTIKITNDPVKAAADKIAEVPEETKKVALDAIRNAFFS